MKYASLLLFLLFSSGVSAQTRYPQHISAKVVTVCSKHNSSAAMTEKIRRGNSLEERMCAIYQYGLTPSNLTTELEDEMIQALSESDIMLQFTAVRSLSNARRPIKRAAPYLREFLHKSNAEILPELMNALLVMAEPLDRDQSERVLEFLNNANEKDLVGKTRGAILLSVYGASGFETEGIGAFAKILNLLSEESGKGDPEKSALLKRYAVGVGGNFYRLGSRAEKLISIVPEYIKLLRTNLPANYRANFVIDLGHLKGAASETVEIICEQFKFQDNFLNHASTSALHRLGFSEKECTKNGSAPLPMDNVSAIISLASSIKDSDYKSVQRNDYVEKPCVDFHKNPLGDACKPSELTAELGTHSMLRLTYKCPENRRGYIGWHCRTCKDKQLRMGISRTFPYTPKYHYIHAFEPGTYQVNFVCSPPGMAGGFGGAGFSVIVP